MIEVHSTLVEGHCLLAFFNYFFFYKGMALVDRDVKPQVIHYFNVCHLPEDASERLVYTITYKSVCSPDLK